MLKEKDRYRYKNPTTEPLFWIAYSDDKNPIVHHGEIMNANWLAIGSKLGNLETFPIKAEGAESKGLEEYNDNGGAEEAYWARLAEFDIYPKEDLES